MKKLILPLFILSSIIATAQNLRVFNYDDSNFPIIKANFFIYQNSKIDENSYPEDFQIISNNNKSVIKNFKYSNYYYNDPLNSYFYFDINKTNRNDLALAKHAAKFWIEVLQKTNYKTSLNAYFDNFIILSDIRDTKEFALKQINKLSYSSNYSLQNPFKLMLSDSLKYFANAKEQNILIYFVNNDRNFNLSKEELAVIKSRKAKLYVVGIACELNQNLKQLAISNEGKFYEYIDSEEKIESTLFEIAYISNNHNLPEISWQMTPGCSNPQTFRIHNIKYDKFIDISKQFDLDKLIHLKSDVSAVDFGVYTSGLEIKRSIKLTAVNGPISVDNIDIQNNTFSVYPYKFNLAKDESITLNLSHLAYQDSSYHFAELKFRSQSCNLPSINLRAQSKKGINPSAQTLNFEAPIANEILYTFKDNYAYLQGVLETDTLRIDYSYDGGQTWDILNKSQIGSKVDLSNLPHVNSKDFILRAQMIIKSENLPFSEIQTHNNSFQITSFAQSPDNRIFITAARDGDVLVWDAKNSTFIARLDINSTQYIKEIVFTPDGSEVYLIEHPNVINVFNTKSYENIKRFEIDADFIKEFAFTSDSKYYTMTTDKNFSVLYDRKTDAPFRIYKAPENSKCRIAFSPDGKYVLTHNSKENLLRVFEIENNQKKLSKMLDFVNFDFLKFTPSSCRVAILNYSDFYNSQYIDLISFDERLSSLSYNQKFNYSEQYNYRKYFFDFVNMDERIILPSPKNQNEFIVYDFVTKRIFQTIKLNPIGSKADDFYNFKLSSDNMRLFYDDAEFVYSQNIHNPNDVLIYPANIVFNSVIHLPKSDKILIKYLDDYSYMTTNNIGNFKHISNSSIYGIEKNININHVLFIENDRILKLNKVNNSISLLLINRLDGAVIDSMFLGTTDNIVLDSSKIIQYRYPYVNLKLAILPKNAYSPIYEYHIINFELKYLHYNTSKIDKAFLNFNNQYLICNKTYENSNSLHIIDLNTKLEVNSFSKFSEKFTDFIPINNTNKIFIYYKTGKTAIFDYRINSENLVYNFNQPYDSALFSSDGSTFVCCKDTIINSKYNYQFVLHKEVFAKPVFMNFKSDYKINTTITDDGQFLLLYNKNWLRSYKLSDLNIYTKTSPLFELKSSNLNFQNIDLGNCFESKTIDTIINNSINNIGTYPISIKKIEIKSKDSSRFVYLDKIKNKTLNPGESLAIRLAYYPDGGQAEQDSIIVYYDNSIEKFSVNAHTNQQLFLKSSSYVYPDRVQINDSVLIIIYPFKNISQNSIMFKSYKNLNIDDSEFSIKNFDNFLVLKPQESLDIEILYKPKQEHFSMAAFDFYHDHEKSPEQITVIAQGTNINSIPKFERIGDLYVYPNPSSGDNIYIKADDFKDTFNVRVVNLLGEKLLDTNSESCQVFDNLFKLDCSKLANGQYYIIFSDGKQQMTANIKILR